MCSLSQRLFKCKIKPNLMSILEEFPVFFELSHIIFSLDF